MPGAEGAKPLVGRVDVRVSIIISARDEDPAVLNATLAGLYATTRHFFTEILVVDDGSRTPVTCGRHKVRLIRNPAPRGVCASRRAGAMAAGGDVLLWIDAHMSFGHGWLEQMLVHIKSKTLLCSPFWSYDLQRCLCWGADFTWNTVRDYPAHKYPGFGFRHRTEIPDRPLVEVPMVIGACYMMRRQDYRDLGGFSPQFRVWGGFEPEISARAWLAGFTVACAAYARVGHLTRNAFPYPVQYEHLEFNQLAMVRSLFEKQTIERLKRCFEPLPEKVGKWLAETDFTAWRSVIQHSRKMSDARFFARFVPELALP